jgi:hypothetical protein
MEKKHVYNLISTFVRQLFIGIDGRVMLEWFFNIKLVRMWAGSSLLRKGTCAEVL